MKGYSFRIRDILILVFLLIMGLTVQSKGQVVIEEEFEIGNNTSKKLRTAQKGISTLSYFDGPQIVVQKDGELKVYIHELMRYLEPLPDSAALAVTVLNKGKKQTQRFTLQQHLDKPLLSQSAYGCPDMWYFYGIGPFSYSRTTGHSTAQDSYVSNSYVKSRDSDGENWEIFSKRNRNYSDDALTVRYMPPKIEENYRRPDPTINYSFLEFDLSIPPKVLVEDAELTLDVSSYMDESDRDYLEQEKNLYLYKVSESWSSSSITWNNQPNIYGDPIKFKEAWRRNINNIYIWYDIDFTRFVKDWVAKPDKNYGFRISLKGGNGYDFVGLRSGNADENERPVLTIDFINPEWNQEKALINVGNVSKGDTIRFAYDNLGPEHDYSDIDGPENNYHYDFRAIEDVVDTSKVKEGYSFLFLNTNKSDFCDADWYPTEFLVGFVYTRSLILMKSCSAKPNIMRRHGKILPKKKRLR